jgi:hypothetical protein
MTQLHCNRCSKEVHPGRGDYYVVRIDAVADPQPPIFTHEDLDQDVGAEIERLIRRMKSVSEKQLERQVFRQKAMYLCVPCFNLWIEDPVSAHDESTGDGARQDAAPP